jgi:hypothetical protein
MSLSPTTNDRPASDKQVSYIRDLFDKADLFADSEFFDRVNAMDATEYAAYIEHLKDQVGDPDDISKPRIGRARASQIIERLKALPRKREAQSFRKGNRDEDIVNWRVGMYVHEGPDGLGDVFRVYLGQQSGKNLVKQLVDTGQPHPEDDRITLHDWQYVGAAAGYKGQRALRGARLMTLAEAKEYGRMTGSCCRCGRRLDVPESVEAGIGPVCAGKVEEWA